MAREPGEEGLAVGFATPGPYMRAIFARSTA
jgi:hypothetical protein